ncbi:patatin-like phospholipase family protein [Nitrosophilus alvini]|uniref:patatin-like phospholipase family protein n=1 Tax=Nitrosophilus alvini TaxID=2714855 RepID=UPI00190BC34B|nr:patatin-like phospholipase family protein [Nitrosophilus alvini]
MADNKKFKILSLDGGGVRGYLSVRILENIEKHLNEKEGNKKPLGERFDLIVGTSTGAIIAGLLAICKSAKEIRKFYENDIPIIFGKQMRRKKIAGASIMFPKYKPSELQKKAESYFEGLTFEDVKIDLVVTTVDISTMTPRLYKSDFADKNKGRVDEKLSSAIIASVSAPVYFPVARNLKHSDYLIDGGVVANNPSMIGITDALTFERNSKRGTPKPTNLGDILLLSIGTGEQTEKPYDLKPLLNTGGLDWLFQIPLGKYEKSTPLIDIIMASQAKLIEFQAKTLLEVSSGAYRRINPKLSSKMKLDDVECFGELKNISDLVADDIKWINENMIGENL